MASAELCSCLASWLVDAILSANVCIGCSRSIVEKEARHDVLLIPCAHPKHKDEIHVYQLTTHNTPCGVPGLEKMSRCSLRFHARLQQENRAHLFDLLHNTSLQQVMQMPDKELEALTHLTLMRHVFTELCCAYCGSPEQRDYPLQRCGTCKKACYCNRDCQKKHWEVTHRVNCGGGSGNKK